MRKLIVIAVAWFLAACAPQPTIQTGPDAETTFDGLVRVDNSRFANAWVDPDVDLTADNKIIPGGAEFQFRSVQKTSRIWSRKW